MAHGPRPAIFPGLAPGRALSPAWRVRWSAHAWPRKDVVRHTTAKGASLTLGSSMARLPLNTALNRDLRCRAALPPPTPHTPTPTRDACIGQPLGAGPLFQMGQLGLVRYSLFCARPLARRRYHSRVAPDGSTGPRHVSSGPRRVISIHPGLEDCAVLVAGRRSRQARGRTGRRSSPRKGSKGTSRYGGVELRAVATAPGQCLLNVSHARDTDAP